MDVFNAILNALGLLLWSLWWVRRENPSGRAGSRRWPVLAALVALVVFRAYLYRALGTPLGWVFHLNVVVVSIPFDAENFSRMLLYSPLSFLKSLFILHTVVAAVAVLARPVPSGGAAGWMFQRLRLAGAEWPGWLSWLTGMVAATLLWLGVAWILQAGGLMPGAVFQERLIQAALIGAAVSHVWLWTFAALLLLALVNRHLYLGAHPLWVWIAATASNSMRRVEWIPARFAGMDLRPLAGAALAAGLSVLLGWLMGLK